MKKIAIIGSGISGLTCAHLLHKKHAVSVFEAGDYIGGHTATKKVRVDNREWAIDSGFIVFNDRTYPNFEKLLQQIGVDKLATEMSFSVANLSSGLEYNGNNLNSLFAQRRNICNVDFLKLIKEILAFNKGCNRAWENNQLDRQITLGEYLHKEGFSDYFCQNYILPMGAAIWSSSLQDMLDFPLYFFVRFFYQHGLLSVNNRPQWYVIANGSNSYIKPLIKGFEHNIALNAEVTEVFREHNGIKLKVSAGPWQYFDEVIFACHSDQAMRILQDISPAETSILRQIQYQQNDVVLHTDSRLLPENKRAWAAWNYRLHNDKNCPVAVTYNMKILQQLPADAPTFCVSLNQSSLIDASKILGQYQYSHPVFNQQSFAAQQQRSQICGKNHTHFAGAYWYNGFHEDGVKSALDVCKRFAVPLLAAEGK